MEDLNTELKDISKQPLVKAFWHELYIELMSSPLDHRTDKQFCEENKLHINTLSMWKKNHRKSLYDEVQRRRGTHINEMRAAAYKALMARCSDKDVNAIKLLFTLTGDLVEQNKITHEYLSRADKIDRINSLLKDANDKSTKWAEIQAKKVDADSKHTGEA